MSYRFLVRWCLVIAVTLLAGKSPLHAARIAYVDKFDDVKLAQEDGSGAVTVSSDGFFNRSLQLSGDARWIAFCGYRGSDSGLWVVRAAAESASNQPVLVAAGANSDGRISWHPANRFIAYSKPGSDGYLRMYVLRVFDEQGNLTPESANNPAVQVAGGFGLNYYDAAFSPEGRSLALGTGSSITVLQVLDESGAITPLSSANAEFAVASPIGAYTDKQASWPSWSPDGTKLVFKQIDQTPTPQTSALAVINVRNGAGALIAENSTSNPRILLTAPLADQFAVNSPAWSPDGAQIAFSDQTAQGDFNVYTLLADRVEGATNPRVAVTTNGDGGGRYPSYIQPGGPGDAGAATAPVPRKIAAWWPADDTVADIAGGTHSSSPTNSPNYGAGTVGRAFTFDGSTQSLETGATTLMNTLPLTIEGWVKPELRNDAAANAVHPPNVISNDKYGSGGVGFGAFVFQTGSELVVGTQSPDQDRYVVPGATFTAGEWAHVAIVYTTGSAATYVNGVLIDTKVYAQGTLDGEDFIRIGRHNEDTSYGTLRFFKGAVDELSIYRRALPAAEIAAIAGAPQLGKVRDDASRQFTTSSPQAQDARWSYGSLAAGSIDPATFALMSGYTSDGTVESWRNPVGADPQVRRNASADIVSRFSSGTEQRFAPQQVALHPGPNGEYAVLRWKAPAAGRYAVSGSFTGIDSKPTTSDAHIFHNSVALFDAQVASFLGNGHVFTGFVDAAQGDTVDFIVGRGANNAYDFDSTGLIASVVAVPDTQTPTAVTIVSAAPPTNDRQWLFTATRENDATGLKLRVQTATASAPNSWTDIDVSAGTNEMTPPETGGDVWTLALAVLPIDVGNYFFRVVATVPGVGEFASARVGNEAFGGTAVEPIPVSAPGEPPPGPAPIPMPPTVALGLKVNNKANVTVAYQGQTFEFLATQPFPAGMPRDTRVRVQYSATPASEPSWENLPESRMDQLSTNKTGRVFRLTTSSVPFGPAIYFRTLTEDADQVRPSSAGPVISAVVKPVGPLNIAAGPYWDFVGSRVSSASDTSGKTAFVGDELTYRVRFKNEGTAAARNVVVTMVAPKGTSVVDFTPATTSINETVKGAATRVIWTIPSVAPNQTVTRNLVVKVQAKIYTAIVSKTADFTVAAKTLQGGKEVAIQTQQALPEALRVGEFLTTQVLPGIKIEARASTGIARAGETIDYTLTATNPSGEVLKNAFASFRLPFGTSVEYVRERVPSGAFTGAVFTNPGPDTNPLLTAYAPGARQLLGWDIGDLPANASRNLEFTLRVHYDLISAYAIDGVAVPTALMSGEYNLTAALSTGQAIAAFKTSPASIPDAAYQYDGKTYSLYAGGPPIIPVLISDDAPVTQPPHLKLSKTAIADGEVAGPEVATRSNKTTLSGFSEVSTVIAGSRITYQLAYENTNLLGANGQPITSSPGRNVTIHDEIPDGVNFLGWVKRDGVLINSSLGFICRNKDGLTVPMGGEPFADANGNGKADRGEFTDLNGNKKFDAMTDIRFIDYNAGTLAGGAGGTISYDVTPTLAPGSVIISRSGDSIIPSNKGYQYRGFSITSENLLTAFAGNPRNLVSLVITRGSLDLQPIVIDTERLVPGGMVAFEAPFHITGGEGLEYPDLTMKLLVPKNYLFDAAGSGFVDPTVPRSQALRPLRSLRPGESLTLATTPEKNGDRLLTVKLGTLPGGAKGIVRVRLGIANPIPPELLDASGAMKNPLVTRVELTAGSGRPSSVGRAARAASSLTGAAALLQPPPASGLMFAQTYSPAQSDLMIGRVAPISVERGQQFQMTIFFANVTDRLNQTSQASMAIPPGTRLVHVSPMRWHYKSASDGRYTERANQYKLLPNATKPTSIVFEALDMFPSDAAAVTVTFQVDENFNGGVIEDLSLTAKGAKSFGRCAPKMAIKVPASNFFTWVGSFYSDLCSSLFGVFNQAAADALKAQESTLTLDSRVISVGGASFVHLSSGSIVIPLLQGRSLVVGPAGTVQASAANVLVDDGITRVAVGADYTPGFKVGGIPQFPGSVFAPGDILTGLARQATSMVAAGAGNIVAAGGGNLIGQDGASLLNNSTGALTATKLAPLVTSNLVSPGGGNIIAAGGGNIFAVGGGSLVNPGGGNMVAAGAGNLIGQDGNSMIAAGGGNLVAAGAGNLVNAGGLNFVAGNIPGLINVEKAKPAIVGGGIFDLKTGVGIISRDGAGILSHNGGLILSHNGGL